VHERQKVHLSANITAAAQSLGITAEQNRLQQGILTEGEGSVRFDLLVLPSFDLLLFMQTIYFNKTIYINETSRQGSPAWRVTSASNSLIFECKPGAYLEKI
jgi:hypothetical protein